MACPAVAGVMAQMWHAYRDLHAGADPETGLMKALALNTAEDYGNAGPDFTYGWGRINGRRAVEALEDQRYLDSTISMGQTFTHNLNIPANVVKAKIMLYWTDKEGSTTALTALVNDLDLTVTDPSSTVHNPWLLNAGLNPTVASVTAPALKGQDNLNNMEQVEIDNPAMGVYTLTVAGTSVPQGPQKYFITYEFLYDDITVTYPNGGEGLVPGETERVRWDATGNTGNFTIEYSVDNGSNWLPATNATGGVRYADWNVPNG